MIKKDTNTKPQILKKAGQLFSQRGYFGVSMQDIANELKITKAALYYHFESKDALAEELLRHAVEELEVELKTVIKTSNPSDGVFNLIKTLLDFRIKHPEISLLTTLGSGTDERVPILALVSDLQQELVKVVRDLVEEVDFTRKLTYKAIVTLTTAIISVTLSPFSLTPTKNSKQIAQDFSTLLTAKNSSVGITIK